jgi:hypothetical protein
MGGLGDVLQGFPVQKRATVIFRRGVCTGSYEPVSYGLRLPHFNEAAMAPFLMKTVPKVAAFAEISADDWSTYCG